MNSRKERRRPPFWSIEYWNPTCRRIAARIETVDDARRKTQSCLRILKRHRSRRARALIACTSAGPCRDIACGHCGRQYRVWFAWRALQLARARPKAQIWTIHLREIPANTLCQTSVARERGKLRKRLVTAGVTKAFGGTELAFNQKRNLWILHVHLLVLERDEDSEPRFRDLCRRDHIKRQLVCQNLRNPISQLTYLQKFITGHRPRAGWAPQGGGMVPLPSAELFELLSFWRTLAFEDHLFLMGLRRRGREVVQVGKYRKGNA